MEWKNPCFIDEWYSCKPTEIVGIQMSRIFETTERKSPRKIYGRKNVTWSNAWKNEELSCGKRRFLWNTFWIWRLLILRRKDDTIKLQRCGSHFFIKNIQWLLAKVKKSLREPSFPGIQCRIIRRGTSALLSLSLLQTSRTSFVVTGCITTSSEDLSKLLPLLFYWGNKPSTYFKKRSE